MSISNRDLLDQAKERPNLSPEVRRRTLISRDALAATLTVFRNLVHDNIHKRFGIFVEPGTTRPPNMPFYRNLPGYCSEGVDNLFNRSVQPYLAEAVYAPGRNIKLTFSQRL